VQSRSVMKTAVRCVRTFTLLAALLTGAIAKKTAGFDPLRWVDPLIGSRDGGNVFAGATLPYGMVKGRLSERNLGGQLLTTFQPLQMWMARIPEDFPQMAATSPAFQLYMTLALEETRAWATFPSFLRSARAMISTHAIFQLRHAQLNTAMIQSKHGLVILV
jgi:hypothetical protein